mmetsp:Transcript_30974/g.95836  ORF Transcript_30974/g.95836 Transcript_30974/m.95836 type:complete len:346 (-) Transcript_30974:8-1045(-)
MPRVGRGHARAASQDRARRGHRQGQGPRESQDSGQRAARRDARGPAAQAHGRDGRGGGARVLRDHVPRRTARRDAASTAERVPRAAAPTRLRRARFHGQRLRRRDRKAAVVHVSARGQAPDQGLQAPLLRLLQGPQTPARRRLGSARGPGRPRARAAPTLPPPRRAQGDSCGPESRERAAGVPRRARRVPQSVRRRRHRRRRRRRRRRPRRGAAAAARRVHRVLRTVRGGRRRRGLLPQLRPELPRRLPHALVPPQARARLRGLRGAVARRRARGRRDGDDGRGLPELAGAAARGGGGARHVDVRHERRGAAVGGRARGAGGGGGGDDGRGRAVRVSVVNKHVVY